MNESRPSSPIGQYHAALDSHEYAAAAQLLPHLAETLFHSGNPARFLQLVDLSLPAELVHYPNILVSVGDAWRLQDHWSQANRAYLAAQHAAESRNDCVTTGQALSRRGLVCWLRGDIEGSLVFFGQAREVLAGTDPEHPMWAEVDAGWLLALSYVGRLDEAEAIGQRQIRTSQRRADLAGEWMALHNLGLLVDVRRGDFAAADAILNEAFQVAQQSNNVFGMAYLANSVAYVDNLRGASESALEWSQQAHTLGSRLLDAPNILAFALLNQAHAQHQRGDRCAATAACEHGLAQIQSAFSSPLRCDLWLMQARIEAKAAPDHALHLAQKALDTAHVVGDQWMIGQCLLVVAECALFQGDSVLAEASLAQATTIFERYADRYHTAQTHKLKAQLAHQTGDWHHMTHYLAAFGSALSNYPQLVATDYLTIVELLASAIEHNCDTSALSVIIGQAGEHQVAVAGALLAHPASAVRLWCVGVLREQAHPWAWQLLAQHCDAVAAITSAIRHALLQAQTYPLPALQIKAFGHFSVTQGETIIAEDRWTSLHAQIILAYLALHGATTREQLIELVWPDHAVAKTGTRLRTTIKLLRQSLRPCWHPAAEYICFQNDRYRLAPSVEVTCDVQQFRHTIAQARRQHGLSRYELCAQALTTYTGDFLAGCFNEWVLEHREQLYQDYLWAHEECAAMLLVEQRYAETEHHARCVIERDPLRERAWHVLIQLLDTTCRTAEANDARHGLAEQTHLELGLRVAVLA